MKAAICTRYGPPEVLQIQDVLPVIGRRYPLADAHRYVELRHKKGNVILDIGESA